jgi:hypothetical protein
MDIACFSNDSDWAAKHIHRHNAITEMFIRLLIFLPCRKIGSGWGFKLKAAIPGSAFWYAAKMQTPSRRQTAMNVELLGGARL